MTQVKSYLAIGVVAAVAAVLFMKEQSQPPVPMVDETALPAKGVSMTPSMAYFSRSVPGNYLAARFAIANDDLNSANKFYARALSGATAPELKEFLLERNLPAAIGAGDMPSTLRIAKQIDIKKPYATGQLAVLVQVIEAFKKGDAEQVKKLLPDVRNDGFGRLLKPLLETWNYVGLKQNDRAIATLHKLAKDYPSLKPLTEMHLAFVYDLAGQHEKAAKYYKLSQANHLSVRSAYLIGRFYEHEGKVQDAISLYDHLRPQVPGSSLPDVVIDRLKKGNVYKTPVIRGPKDGVAAALYDVATVLYQENSARLAILYAQLAHYLTPEDEFVGILLGDILAATNVPTQSESYFKSIPENSDMYVLAQMRLAQLYQQEKDYAAAVRVLEKLEKDVLSKNQALLLLGDLYRMKEDFAKAIPYYTMLIERTEKPTEKDWVIFYARGICYERNDEWDKAEADLLQALKLSPQQPEVLNYLAYSWADHGKNLKKSLLMLQKALASAPEDPYIADSVGWALYKTGRGEEAVPYLEAAIQQLPDDPVINSHLGDVYWSVDRQLEARFQWGRALKNAGDSDKKLQKELQDRLEHGLPAPTKQAAEK